MTIALDNITLPDDLLWADRYKWSAVNGKQSITLGGNLIIEESKQLSGRPITLVSAPDSGWVTQAVVEQLRAKAEVAGATLTLTLHDQSGIAVAFNRVGGAAVEATPVIAVADPDAATRYTITLRLIGV